MPSGVTMVRAGINKGTGNVGKLLIPETLISMVCRGGIMQYGEREGLTYWWSGSGGTLDTTSLTYRPEMSARLMWAAHLL